LSASSLSGISRLRPLRRPDVTAPNGSTHYRPARDEIDVVPAQRPQLADAKSGANREREHRFPFEIRRIEEPLALAEVQKVELRRRAPHPLHLGTWEISSQSTAPTEPFAGWRGGC